MEQDMTRGNITSIMLRFAIPLFIGNAFQTFYNMADSIIVGRFLGEEALAAVGSTGIIMFLLFSFSGGVVSGFTILTSQKYGAHDSDGVRRTVSNGCLLALLIGAGATVLGLAAIVPLLRFMNTPENIFADARTYITIICAGTLASLFYNLLSSYLRAIGNSKIPVAFLVFSSLLNIFLDIVFIVKFQLGVAGAAIATITAQGIAALLCGIYIVLKVRVLVPHRSQWKLYRYESREQLRLGIPMAMQFAITASGAVVMQSAMNMFGSTAIAATTAGMKIQEMLIQGIYAMGATMATFVGQNFGSRNLDRIRAGVKRAVVIISIYGAIAAVCMYFLLPVFLKVFFAAGTDMTELLYWAKRFFNIVSLFYIPLGFIFIFRNAMQGCGNSMIPLGCGIVEFFSRIITAELSIHTGSFVLACLCDPMAWLTAGMFAMLGFIYLFRKLSLPKGSSGTVTVNE